MIYRSATYQLVQAMRATGNKPGVIAEWKAGVEAWAAAQRPGRDVDAVRAWLPLWQDRPVYTAAELAPLIPAVAAYLGFRELRPPRSPKRVANRLRYFGLPCLENLDGGAGFVNPATGRYDDYFIVERVHFWAQRALTQRQFEQEFFR